MATAWTTDQLKEYVDAALEAHRRHFDALRAADNNAVRIALDVSMKKHENANEWRQAMDDKDRLLMPRIEAEKGFAGQGERLAALERRADARTNERSGIHAGWSIALAIFGLAALAVGLVLALTPRVVT